MKLQPHSYSVLNSEVFSRNAFCSCGKDYMEFWGKNLHFHKIKKHKTPNFLGKTFWLNNLPFFLSPIIVQSVSAIVIVEESFFRLCSKSHCSISTKNVALSSSTNCWRSRGRLERYSGPIWTPLFSMKRTKKWGRHVKIKKI